MSVRRAERQEWPDPNSNTAEQLKATPSESSDETKDETERSSSKNIKSQTTRPKPRRVLPPLKRDDEFVDLQNVIDKAAPVYEFTHGYMDSIILKCDKCKRHARVEWHLPGFEIKPGPGDRGYSFRCSECNLGKQHFEHTEKTWLDITLTCLYNLELADKDRGGNRFFHVRKEICGFADRHWDTICRGRTRTPTWWATLNAQITTRTDLFETVQHGSGKWALVYSNISSRKGNSPGSPTNSESKSMDGGKVLSAPRPLAVSDSAAFRRPRASGDSGDESSMKESDVDSESNGVSKSPTKKRRPRKKIELSSEAVALAAPTSNRRGGQVNLDQSTPFIEYSDLDPDCAQMIVARIERYTFEPIQSSMHPTHTSSLAISSPSDDVMDLGVGYDAEGTIFSDSASSDLFSVSSSSASMPDTRSNSLSGASTRRRLASTAVLMRMSPKPASTSSSATTTPTNGLDENMNESFTSTPSSQPSQVPPLVWTNVPASTSSEQIASLLGIFEAGNTLRIPLNDIVLKSAAAHIPSLAAQLGLAPPEPVIKPESPVPRSTTPIPRSSTPTIPRASTPVPRASTPTPTKPKEAGLGSPETKKKFTPEILSSPNSKGTRLSTGAIPPRKTPGTAAPPSPAAPSPIKPPTEPTSAVGDALNKSVESDLSKRTPNKKRKANTLSRSAEVLPTGASSTPGVGGPRVTIKDLLDAGMLEIEEHLLFRNTGDPGIVQPDGSIRWRGEVFHSPSTFAKTAARTLGITSQGSFHNGWQYVYARGSPLGVLRDKFMALHAPPEPLTPKDEIAPPAKRHRPNAPAPISLPLVSAPVEAAAPLVPLKADANASSTLSPFDTDAAPPSMQFKFEELPSNSNPFLYLSALHPPVNPHGQLSPSILPPAAPNFALMSSFNDMVDLDTQSRSIDHSIAHFEQMSDLVGSFFE